MAPARTADKDEVEEALLKPSEGAAAVRVEEDSKQAVRDRRLLFWFAAMVVVGCLNRVMSVLAYVPMANYPLLVNLLVTAAYIPSR